MRYHTTLRIFRSRGEVIVIADYSGQTDIFDPSKFTWPVHVIGVGGIGSAVVLPLVKLGLRGELHLWDLDYVEPHNVPAQLIYSRTDVGRPKVEAAAEMLESYREPECSIVPHQEFVTAETPLSGVVISGVDSMQARCDIWGSVKFNPDVPLYLDGRIGGEQMTLLALNPLDMDAVDTYEKDWLFPDGEGAPLPCAARTVIHPPVVLAGHMIAQLTRFARDMELKSYIDVHVREAQLFSR